MFSVRIASSLPEDGSDSTFSATRWNARNSEKAEMRSAAHSPESMKQPLAACRRYSTSHKHLEDRGSPSQISQGGAEANMPLRHRRRCRALVCDPLLFASASHPRCFPQPLASNMSIFSHSWPICIQELHIQHELDGWIVRHIWS